MAQQFKTALEQANAMQPSLSITQMKKKPFEAYDPKYWRNFSKGDYSGSAQVYDEPSQFGIDNGRVSKLWITHKGNPILNYDRGWDTKSGKFEISPEHQEFYNELISALENAEKWR